MAPRRRHHRPYHRPYERPRSDVGRVFFDFDRQFAREWFSATRRGQSRGANYLNLLQRVLGNPDDGGGSLAALLALLPRLNARKNLDNAYERRRLRRKRKKARRRNKMKKNQVDKFDAAVWKGGVGRR